MPSVHPVLTKLRRQAAALPEAAEEITWGHPTFRVRGKIFATFGEHEGTASVSCKQTKLDQALFVEDPRFFVAPYVGRHGWIGIRVDEVAWRVVADLVERSYRLIAPKALVRRLDGD